MLDGLRVFKKCNKEYSMDNFSVKSGKNKIIYQTHTCKFCESEAKKLYYLQNKDIRLQSSKDHYLKNIELKKQYNVEYYVLNKTNIQKQNNIYRKIKRENSPDYKLREDFSTVIRRALKNNGGSKKGSSIKNGLPYSIQELKEHLEKQFLEPGNEWMNWGNNRRYNASNWNDNDQKTWAWQIDHIIPHSTFKYTSMKDQSFKECWALKNLRPLSAKQNWLDGINKIRHKANNVI